MNTIHKSTYSALFIALGMILPFLTAQLQQLGNMLLPMHLPVFLCAFFCGWKYGLLVGLILPILRSVLFSMPVMYPMAIAMAFELGTYGFVAGFLYEKRPWKCIKSLYIALLSAMICGRIVWGLAQFVLLGFSGTLFTWELFFAGAVINAGPGIILQLIIIPAFMLVFRQTSFVRIHSKKELHSHEFE